MDKPQAAQQQDRTTRRRRHAILWAVAMAVLAACSPAPGPAGTPPSGQALEFQGSWSAAGTRRTLVLGGDRRASLIDLRGTLMLSGPSRPGVGFRGEVVALADSAQGLVGHSVWTDERGDQVFSDLRGEGTATHNRISGTFTGGTGRYAGATGSYEFSWQYVIETDDGAIQGRAVALQGRVKMGKP